MKSLERISFIQSSKRIFLTLGIVVILFSGNFNFLPHKIKTYYFISFFNVDSVYAAGTTTVSQGTDPASVTIAPGASATEAGAFNFQTAAGIDVITAMVINLSNASATSKVEITNNAGSTVYGSRTNPTGASTTSITLNNSTLTANTTLTQYKIRITPKTQANMATGTLGMLYPITASVNRWTGTNTNKPNTDGASTTLTIDNQSPAITSSNFASNWVTSTSASNDNWNSVTYGNGLFVAVSGTTTSNKSVMTSPDGVTWTLRTGTTTGSSWYGVTYGNGLFVAVAATTTNKSVMTSPDGITWTSRTSAASNRWASVTYGNGLFVAVSFTGTGNRVMTSPDGITWTSRTSAADNAWNSVTYGNGLFVAIASSGTGNRVMTSPDGITWTSRTSAADNAWYSVTYGNGLFIAVSVDGTGNRVMTSPDGITWTSRTSAADNAWFGITYGNGLFVAVAETGTGNRVMTSPDGITWTSRTSAADILWTSTAYGNGTFVAVSADSSNNRVMRSTTTLPTLTSSNTQVTTSYTTSADPDLNSIIVLRSTSAVVATPVDGTTYVAGNTIGAATVGCVDTTIATSTADSCVTTGLTNGTPYHFKVFAKDTNGNYSAGITPSGSPATPNPVTTVSQGTDPASVTIAPGATATSTGAFMIQTGSGTDVITALVLNLSNATATSKVEITSDNGVTVYGSSTNPTGVATTSITLNNSTLTANTTPTQYKIRITPKTQANMATGTLGMLYPITASVNTWTGTNANKVNTDVASTTLTIDNEPPAVTQNTGVMWATNSGAPTADSWNSIVYGNGLFVAVSATTTSNKSVMTSPDGITWTLRTGTTTNNTWNSVTYGNGTFVAVSATTTTNNVMTSPDGITWTLRTGASSNEWNSITYGNGLFVAVADTGTGNRVMTSPDGITWTSRTSAADSNWMSVTYGNGLFVAVSCGFSYYTWCNTLLANRIMTSPDGINWTLRASANDYTKWESITYGNGTFVAVAAFDTLDYVMTSPDGITWTARTSPTRRWKSVTYGNGLFVAVPYSGSGDYVMTSPDGITWTEQTSAADSNWRSVFYGNNTFVSVASGGGTNSLMISTSTLPVVTSGNSQATTTYTTSADNNLSSIVILRSTSAVVATPVDGTVYTAGNTIGAATVGCVDTTIATSTADSCVTTGLTNGTPYYFKVFAMDSYGNYSAGITPSGSPITPSLTTTISQGTDPASVTIAPGATATSTGAFIIQTGSGTDVITAIVLNLSNATATSKVEITNDAGSTVYGSSTNPTGTATTSITLNNSTLTANTTPTQYKIRITPKTQANMATGTLGMLYPITASVNTWTGTNGNKINTDVASTTLTIDNEPPAVTQNTGVIWATSTSASNDSWNSVAYGNGIFVAVSATTTSNKSVMTSPDGITWTLRTGTTTNNTWNSVTFGNGTFVAVSATTTTNNVMTSPDGITWTLRTGASNNEWNSVTYGNGLFVAVADTGTGNRVMTSQNGITWTSRTSATENNWNSVTYGNGLFVAVSATTTTSNVMTSPDGSTWTLRTGATANLWKSVTYGNGLFVAVAYTGTGDRVMTSSDGITWTSRTNSVDNNWTSVVYSDGLYVAVASSTGTGNRVMTSSDGLTWTSQTSSADNSWNSATFGTNGTFIAVASSGTGNRVMRSTSTVPGLTVGGSQITTTYTTSADTDLSNVMVLYSISPITGIPVDGTSYSVGNSIGTSGVVGCIDTTITPSTSDSCTTTGLINGTTYYFKVFAMDTYGNYSAGISASGSPIAPAVSTTVSQGTDPASVTIGPGATATSTGAFIIQTGSGTDVITAMVINLSNASATSKVEITNDAGTIVYGSSTNPTGVATTSITLNNSTLTATVTPTQYKIRITPKTQANMATGTLGMLYPVTASVNTWTGTNTNKINTDVASTSVTIDNEAPAVTQNTGVTWATSTSIVANQWLSIAYGNGIFVAVSDTGAGNRVMTSPDGITWTSRTSAADNTWRSVAYGNGLFVAVSSSGVGNNIMTSPNGVTWTTRTNPADNDWQSVTYGNGIFVAVAQTGTGNRVMTSPDGITWTSRPSATEDQWRAVTYGNGLFVAVGETGTGNRVMTSPDGINWTSRTSAADNSWYDVTYGNGLFVAVSNDGVGNNIMTSPDGINWTSRTSAADNNWYSITYGNGLFVAVSADGLTNSIMTSSDGITWTSRTSDPSTQYKDVAYGNGTFVGVSWNGSTGPVMRSTSTLPYLTKGDTQVTTSYTTSADDDLSSILVLRSTSAVVDTPVDGTTYVAGNTIGAATVGCVDTTIATSTADACVTTGLTNGTAYHFKVFAMDSRGNYSTGLVASGSPMTPAAATTVSQGTDPASVTIGPGATATSTGAFIIQTGSGTDVITAMVINLSNASATSKVEITNDAGTIVYGSSTNPTGVATTSITLNNSTLTATVTPTQYKIRITPKTQANMATGTLGMLYPVTASVNTWTGTNANKFNTDVASTSVTIDNEAPAVTQNTGVIWATSTSAVANGWRSIAYGNGLFVAVAQSGVAGSRVITSPDGVTWTVRTSAANNSWYSVTYGNGLFVAVSYDGVGNRVMTSPDGINWTSRTNPVDNNWSSVTYGKGLFVAVAYTGTGNRVMTSPDGINWTIRTSAADNEWYGVTYGNGLFVAVASSGTNGHVMTSPDGINWTTRTSDSIDGWTSVTYGNGLFVAVASYGIYTTSMTSPDGINWTTRPTTAYNLINSVTYGNGLFVAVASSGIDNEIMTSVDGITWKTPSVQIGNNWTSVAYGNGTFVAASFNGTNNRIMRSTSTLPTLTPGNAQVRTNYITSADPDLSSIVVLRSTSAIVATPVDGTTYVAGNTIGAATVGCVDTTIATSTPDSCVSTGLTNGTPYYFKVFAQDIYGNYSAGLTPTKATSTPAVGATQIQVSSFRFRNDNGDESSATYVAPENADLTSGFFAGDGIRLRMAVSNQGAAPATLAFGMDYATSTCTIWSPVPRPIDTTYHHFKLDSSPYIADNQATTQSGGLTPPGGKTFTFGSIQTFNAGTPSITLAPTEYTELEFYLRSTANVTPYTNYCFRLSNLGDATGFTYVAVPHINSYAKEFRYQAGGGIGGGPSSGTTGGFTAEIELPVFTATTTVTGGGAHGGNASTTEATTTPDAPKATSTPGGGGGGGDIGMLYKNNYYAYNTQNLSSSRGTVLGASFTPMCVDMKSRMLHGVDDTTTNGEVSQLQYYLRHYGYFNATVTGMFGKKTEEAIKQFQRDNKIIVTGIAGKKTRETMKNLGCIKVE